MRHYRFDYPFDPSIATEETMFKRLLDSNALDDTYTLCVIPLAHIINTLGVGEAQKEIDKVKAKGKKLFVCQHILVNQLKFDADSIVCTPHASLNGSYISIPHFPVNIDTSILREKRTRLFSFMGSTQTHEIRRGLTVLYPNNCFDSGALWALDPSLKNKDELRKNYIELLADSDFSLCPRGTGISSVRLFESMAMGAIPVIIADGYQPPLPKIIDWSKVSIRVKSNQISKIGSMLQESFGEDKIQKMRELVMSTYNEFLSPENFEKSIILSL